MSFFIGFWWFFNEKFCPGYGSTFWSLLILGEEDFGYYENYCSQLLMFKRIKGGRCDYQISNLSINDCFVFIIQ